MCFLCALFPVTFGCREQHIGILGVELQLIDSNAMAHKVLNNNKLYTIFIPTFLLLIGIQDSKLFHNLDFALIFMTIHFRHTDKVLLKKSYHWGYNN